MLLMIFPNLTLERQKGGQMNSPIGFSNLKIKALKQWKLNFQYL